MAHIFRVTVAKGMEDLLVNELQQLGIAEPQLNRGMVEFEAGLEQAYRVCLYSRVASRVLMPLITAPVATEEDLYQLGRQINWSDHMEVTGSFAVDSVVNHPVLTNSHYTSLKLKDAIVDQFRESLDHRPNVEKYQPDIRIHLYLNPEQATISLDLSGDALHKRGYRTSSVKAPLKESLAAAILLRAGWPAIAKQGGVLLDPMCGSGTLLTEAVMIAADIAPGVLRPYYGFIHWKGHDKTLWKNIHSVAYAHYQRCIEENTILRCYGYDEDNTAINAAKENARQLDFSSYILLRQQSLEQCRPPEGVETGLFITNPPYGERLGDQNQLRFLYSDLGDHLKQYFDGWQASVFSCNEALLKHVGLRAHKTNRLYNGPLSCQLNHYRIRSSVPSKEKFDIDLTSEHAMMFRNRLQKNIKHLGRWARKRGVHCYRLYDADIPEFAFAIDQYDGRLHVQEYQAPGNIEPSRIKLRQRQMLAVLQDVTGIHSDHIVFKTRSRQRGLSQYEKQQDRQEFLTVEEGGLKFLVNLTDYLDTGLFLDHRITREMIRKQSPGCRVLNLFAYTGSISVYAADGGASSVTTIDMSNTYLQWAKRNFEINGFKGPQYQFIQADCLQWLTSSKDQYDLIMLDPPSFSNSKRMQDTFDVQRDHVELIRDCMRLLSDEGQLVFSNNLRNFKLDQVALQEYQLKDITQQTIPEDFTRHKGIHHCWVISH